MFKRFFKYIHCWQLLPPFSQLPSPSMDFKHTKKPKHNFTCLEDYIERSSSFKKKFSDKGYPALLVDEAYNHFLSEIPQSRNLKSPSLSQAPRLITQFHTQHRKMEHILQKYWGILLEDPHLKNSLDEKPKITYRGAQNLKEKIAPSKLKTCRPQPSVSPTFLDIKGMYQCRKLNCLTCKFVQHKQKHFTTKDKTFQLGQFFNCSTEFVVYCLSCPCNLLYVGCTTRTLRKRFGEHRQSIEDNKNLTIPRHFTEFH